MARLQVVLLGLVLLTVLGCDDDKIAHLEKENADLKAQLAKQNNAADFDLQAKCSSASKAWFNENWASTSRDKATTLLEYSNHYNKASNKCFATVEYHFTQDANGSWMNDMSLWDVLENSEYGKFGENHMISFSPARSEDNVFNCEMTGTKCKTVAEWNDLVQPYMNN